MELASSTVDSSVPRDTCDSPTMPCLSPEVPSFGELPDLVGPPVLYGKDGPPVLYSKDGPPVLYGKDGPPVLYNKDGPPVLYGKDGPPVLTQFGEDDVCDHASEKSEGRNMKNINKNKLKINKVFLIF